MQALRLPDPKYQRLKTQFEIRASRGQNKVERGLELLAKAKSIDSE